MNPVLYAILNSSLNMSPGKAAAQTAHAVMGIENKHRDKFMEKYRRTVIVLEAKGREQLDGIAEYLSEADMDYFYYIDEGINEVDAFSFTALAVEPIDADDTDRREIFAGLPLYSGPQIDKNQIVINELDKIPWDERTWYVSRAIKWFKKRYETR